MKRIIFAILALLIATSGYCQSDLAEEEENAIKTRVQEKVRQLTDYIEFLANPENDFKERQFYRSKALNLFIARGESYESESGVREKGVFMEVTSIYRSKPSRRLMKDYFTGLMEMRYSKVIIESTDFGFSVSDLKQIDEDLYVCTCYFEQAFCGYKDGTPIYKDITRKKVKIYIVRETIIDDNGDLDKEYIVMLGDVTALETRRVI